MPSESCYVTLMENAILLFVAYGLLASYFEDVMYYGFLFFAVFIGLCTCYASTAAGFCLMLLDDTTSTQLLLLDAEREFQTTPPNNIAHAARIMARAATTCSVALFVLFLTVGCELFTEDSGPSSLSATALKKDIGESVLATQFAVSTAFAVYVIIMLMLIGSSQQLNGIFLRLQYMTQSVPLPPEQAAAYATAADDLALFVRALLGLYVVICGSTGTFQETWLLSLCETFEVCQSIKTAIGGDQRNYVALGFISWCLLTDALRAVLPTSKWPILIVVIVIDLAQGFVNWVLAEVLIRDRSLTNFACAVLVIFDAVCVLYASLHRILEHVRTKSSAGAHQEHEDNRQTTAVIEQNLIVPPPPPALLQRQPSKTQPHNEAQLQKEFSKATGFGLCFSEAHFNVDNIKMRVFEKKSN